MVDNVHEYRPLDELVSNIDLRQWKSPGPVSSAFLASTSLVRGLLGPYGSGKTTTMLVGEVEAAIKSPRCLDGVRRYRVLGIRDNYRQLYKTLIPSWHDLFKPSDGDWSGGQDRPAEHKLKFMDDYGPVEFEILFAAIPEGSIRDWLDGFQPSSIIINAASSIPEDVFTYGIGRIGRYPRQAMLPPGFAIDKHIAFDSNKDDVESTLYRLCVAAKTDDVDVHDQPGGLDHNAENIGNLNPTYYQDMARANAHRPWWVNINVHNRWGPSRSGAAVYPEFDHQLHVSPHELEADPNLELCLGLDAGTTNGGRPAAVFFQIPAGPRVRVLDELFLGRCGPKRFFEAVLDALERPWLRRAKRLRGWGDPSAFVGADKEGGELTWIEMAEKAIGMTIEQPVSNELHNFRIPTVAATLTSLIGPGDPMFRISPRCALVIAGFNSGYCYPKTEKKKQGEVEAKMPEKNDYSHPHDGLQHGLTGYFGKSLLLHGMRSLRDPDAERGPSPSPFSFDFKI